MLAYFVDPDGAELMAFLERQRVDRRRRLFVMADALDRLGVPVDRVATARGGRGCRPAGRPDVPCWPMR